jgi:glycosyltransferase involved in cell wall biosynthesis
MAYLPRHVDAIAQWTDLAEQIVVVDSESKDGTPEYIRSHLRHPRLQIFSRPRGLYQAWNFGIAQIQSKYTYVATVGDSATREGIQHLVSVAESLNGDVVISPPEFFDADGKPMLEFCWPVHRFLQRSKLTEPRLLRRDEVVMAAFSSGFESFLGSSASNLYRTETLQKAPFPCDFGNMGDTIWGILNCAAINVAVTPKPCAAFVFHPKEHEPDYAALAPKLARIALDMKLKLRRDPAFSDLQDIEPACESLVEAALSVGFQSAINEARRQGPSLRSNLRAFVARMKRNVHRRRLERLHRRFQHPSLFARNSPFIS